MLEVCETLGIDRKTYRRHEGTLFPVALRDPKTGFRIFTKYQTNQLKKLWDKRTEYYSRNRHYHYHKTKNFYSFAEACKLIGISKKTFKKYEGGLFSMIWRDDKAGRRLFTGKDIEQIRKTWEEHKKRK
jgi:predicted site-specific integrase-resolvase